mmetsp:Transcript_29587/g.49737  ORF Transcript_29587/g.49737 Transcript_29587/m.49737 type:complete len:342 (+) Transcript_29587:964-1989(+)
MILRCSSSACGQTICLCASMCRPAHVEVMELVCWPANSTAISMPVISSSDSPVPFLYRASMNACNTSGSDCPLSRRLLMIFEKIFESSARAQSRLRCAAMGRYGNTTEMGSMPISRWWNSSLTFSNSCSRTSLPIKQRLAVRMMRSESCCKRSTSPSSPHLSKKASASMTIMPTYVRMRFFLSASAKKRNCSMRTLWSTSNTTPLPKVGTLNSYTSFWLISRSFALKKCEETSGPIRNVMRLWKIFTENTLPCFAYAASMSGKGPLINFKNPPMIGIPPTHGGLLEFSIPVRVLRNKMVTTSNPISIAICVCKGCTRVHAQYSAMGPIRRSCKKDAISTEI